MASLTNIRLHTITRVIPDEGDFTLASVMVDNGTLLVQYTDGPYYILGSVSNDDYVIPTPLEPQCPCGENTSNSNVLATLLKGADGVTPDMSDYYDKGVVEEKLAKKQDVITDLATIRSNASRGATALQSVPSEYVTESELSAKGYLTSVPSEYVTDSELSAKGYATTSQVNAKQDKISDLDTIRSGAAKGATAVQKSSLASVATSGSYNDLSEKPAIPSAVTESTVSDWGFTKNTGTISSIKINGAINRRIDSNGTIELGDVATAVKVNGNTVYPSDGVVNLGEISGGGGGGVTAEYVDNAVAEVNVKGEDGYVYSNGEKVDMRFTRSLLPVGTSIPAKANLNTIAYLKVGKYYCSLNVDAETITNCPVNVAFSMEVFNPLGTNVDDEETKAYCYRIRILTEFNTGIQYIQYCNTGATAGSWTYASWYVTPRTSFTLNSSKNDGSAAKGAATRGVYIDSTGTFQQMTYTLSKSVPSNAVFTDTNTKVTAVGNHYTPAEDTSVAINAPEGEVVVGLKRDAAGHVVGVKSVTAVNFANDLTGVVEATPEEFSFRPSAGDRSIRDESAVIRRIKGNTIVWNQLVRNGKYEEGTSAWSQNSSAISIDTDGSLKVQHISDNSQGVSQILYDRIPKGHKVLVVIDYKRSSATKKNLLVYLRTKSNTWDMKYVYDIADDKRRVDSVIITTTDDIVFGENNSVLASIIIYPFIGGSVEEYSNIYKVNAFDLTRMFGAGNEPTSYAEFVRIFPQAYYSYSAPVVMNMKTSAIHTVGFNQYDGESAPVIAGQTYYIGGNVQGIAFSNEVANDVDVPLTNDSLYTFDSSGSIRVQGDDICVHLHHSGIKDGECAPYVDNYLMLPEVAKHFPNGMVGNADVWDEINSDEVIKRWAVVDMSTLEWSDSTVQSGAKRWYSASLVDLIKGGPDSWKIANVICSNYAPTSADDTYLGKDGVGVSKNGTILVYDSNYSNKDSKDAFIASLKGVLLYYEMGISEHLPLEEPIQLAYEIEDFGTEEALSPDSYTPFRADIVYQFNAEGRIRDNSRNIERLERKVEDIADMIISTLNTPV